MGKNRGKREYFKYEVNKLIRMLSHRNRLEQYFGISQFMSILFLRWGSGKNTNSMDFALNRYLPSLIRHFVFCLSPLSRSFSFSASVSVIILQSLFAPEHSIRKRLNARISSASHLFLLQHCDGFIWLYGTVREWLPSTCFDLHSWKKEGQQLARDWFGPRRFTWCYA